MYLYAIARSSRSPSVASNRESMVSLGDDLTPVAEQNPAIPPPPLPAGGRKPGVPQAVSDPESASLSSGTNEYECEKPAGQEEMTVPSQPLRGQRGPPPTPPRKPYTTPMD